MSSHSQSQERIFQVQDFIELDYAENQRLTTSITITNLTDQVISFNVRINVPNLYPVVKPAEGVIYGGDNHKVTISRVPLSKEDYELCRQNPNITIKDTFQISCSLEYTEHGRIQTREQSKTIPVRIRRRSMMYSTSEVIPETRDSWGSQGSYGSQGSLKESAPTHGSSVLPVHSSSTQPSKNTEQQQQLHKLTKANKMLEMEIDELSKKIARLRSQPQQEEVVFDKGEIIVLSIASALVSLCLAV